MIGIYFYDFVDINKIINVVLIFIRGMLSSCV